MISDRLFFIRGRVAAALERSGQPERDICIVAVTKHHTAQTVEEVAAAGLLDVGENRVLEATAKAAKVSAPVRWHLRRSSVSLPPR